MLRYTPVKVKKLGSIGKVSTCPDYKEVAIMDALQHFNVI